MKKGIIICVDDEKIILDSLKTELKNSFGDEFIIETAENAMEAIETFELLRSKKFEIPLIISDYIMPTMKGDEFLEKIHQLSPNTLKILLTGQATVEGVTNVINKANLYRLISKPWDSSDLILTVEQAIKSYSQQNQLELQNKQLRELSISLEEKVEKRTKELRKTNELLVEKQDEITSQNNELEEYRNHLEELVKTRTKELNTAKEKAEENDRLKSAFMANISHEIRTPMNGIIGFIDMLRSQEFEKDEQLNFLNLIENCTKQLMAIIIDIVEISKLETNQVKARISPFNTNSIPENLSSLFHYNLERNSDLELNIKFPEEEIECLTDGVKLQQILSNLVTNAIRYTPSGSIDVGLSITNDSNIVFYVKDTGIGIPKEFHKIIFERFRQVDIRLSRRYGGTGLGLAISKAYAELLGGKIWIESEPEKGSTFYLSIPYVPLNKDKAQKNGKNQLNGFHRKTVLVAEDDDTNFLFLNTALNRINFNSIRAKNGEEAVTICKNNENIDLILMDIKMPIMDGFEAAEEILKFRANIPIIAQSAYAFPTDKSKALKIGFAEYITKPTRLNVLIEVLKKHMEKIPVTPA